MDNLARSGLFMRLVRNRANASTAYRFSLLHIFEYALIYGKSRTGWAPKFAIYKDTSSIRIRGLFRYIAGVVYAKHTLLFFFMFHVIFTKTIEFHVKCMQYNLYEHFQGLICY